MKPLSGSTKPQKTHSFLTRLEQVAKLLGAEMQAKQTGDSGETRLAWWVWSDGKRYRSWAVSKSAAAAKFRKRGRNVEKVEARTNEEIDAGIFGHGRI